MRAGYRCPPLPGRTVTEPSRKPHTMLSRRWWTATIWSRRDGGERRLARQHGERVPGREHAHRGARLDRRGAEVRDQDDVLELEQAGVHLGLALEHVESSSRDHAVAQGVRERRLV